MRRVITIILTLAILISCGENRNKSEYIQDEKVENIAFDSTYYFQLNKAYAKKDTSILSELFESWYEISKDRINNNDQIIITIEKIFNEVYQPFELEKYGWLSRPHYSEYKYAVLPNEICFKIVKDLQNPERIYSIQMDTIKPFYPKPDIGNAKRLFDIEPFKTSMKLFLNKNGFQKSFYLDSTNFINIPMSNDWKEYKTSPEIFGILINKQMDSAVVELRLISTGVRIKLNTENGEWKMKEVEELWIE